MAQADASIKDAEVIVNFGDGADGGARIAAGGFLLNADGRRQTGEVIDIRLLQLAEKLPGITGQRLDVAPLAFGVERIEGQRTFARPTDAGKDDELVARQVEIDVAEIVFAGAADDDGAVIHNRQVPPLGDQTDHFLVYGCLVTWDKGAGISCIAEQVSGSGGSEKGVGVAFDTAPRILPLLQAQFLLRPAYSWLDCRLWNFSLLGPIQVR